MRNDWDKIKAGFSKSPNEIVITEKSNSTHCNTVLDVVVNNASVIAVNKYLRLLCSGDSKYENILKFNRNFQSVIGENKYAVAHDAFGGMFALTKSGMHYFSPDTLRWENMEIAYEGFIEWISTNDINEFYASFIWDDFDKYVDNIGNESGILMYPFLWAKECDINTSSKKVVPFHELLETNHEFENGFNGVD